MSEVSPIKLENQLKNEIIFSMKYCKDFLFSLYPFGFAFQGLQIKYCSWPKYHHLVTQALKVKMAGCYVAASTTSDAHHVRELL